MFALAPLFVVGSVLLGVALFLARAVPAWTAALLIVGSVLVPFSSGGGPWQPSPCSPSVQRSA